VRLGTVILISLVSIPAMSQPPADPVSTSTGILNYRPITAKQRVRWFVHLTVGLDSIPGGLLSSGWETLRDRPKEYGTHWEGFGERYGLRLTSIAAGNAMEAQLGAAWGEDPRYIRATGQPFRTRLANVAKMTVLAYGRDGQTMPAYSRYIAIPASNFLSNTWRPESDASARDASVRIALGFVGRMTHNAVEEFWPDIKHHVFRIGQPGP